MRDHMTCDNVWHTTTDNYDSKKDMIVWKLTSLKSNMDKTKKRSNLNAWMWGDPIPYDITDTVSLFKAVVQQNLPWLTTHKFKQKIHVSSITVRSIISLFVRVLLNYLTSLITRTLNNIVSTQSVVAQNARLAKC